MNLYLESETYGSFLIDASISNLVGQKYLASNISSYHQQNDRLLLEILINDYPI
jgi:hypothetical protein